MQRIVGPNAAGPGRVAVSCHQLPVTGRTEAPPPCPRILAERADGVRVFRRRRASGAGASAEREARLRTGKRVMRRDDPLGPDRRTQPQPWRPRGDSADRRPGAGFGMSALRRLVPGRAAVTIRMPGPPGRPADERPVQPSSMPVPLSSRLQGGAAVGAGCFGPWAGCSCRRRTEWCGRGRSRTGAPLSAAASFDASGGQLATAVPLPVPRAFRPPGSSVSQGSRP